MQNSVLESLEKKLLLLLSAIYALGVAIVNFHLSEYGVAGQLGLLRPIYLFAGIYGVLPVSLAAIICWNVISARDSGLTAQQRKTSAFYAAIWLLVSVILLCLINRYIAKDHPLNLGMLTWGFIVLAFLLGFAACSSLRGRFKLTPQSNLNCYLPFGTLALLVVLAYAFTFNASLYNRIPASWGGTRSDFVQFVIAPEEKGLKGELEKAGVLFEKGTFRTEKTKLIIQTDNDYIGVARIVPSTEQVDPHKVEPSETKAIPFILKRDVVKAVIYPEYKY